LWATDGSKNALQLYAALHQYNTCKQALSQDHHVFHLDLHTYIAHKKNIEVCFYAQQPLCK
jgi:hypothetical protein